MITAETYNFLNIGHSITPTFKKINFSNRKSCIFYDMISHKQKLLPGHVRVFKWTAHPPSQDTRLIPCWVKIHNQINFANLTVNCSHSDLTFFSSILEHAKKHNPILPKNRLTEFSKLQFVNMQKSRNSCLAWHILRSVNYVMMQRAKGSSVGFFLSFLKLKSWIPWPRILPTLKTYRHEYSTQEYHHYHIYRKVYWKLT